MSADNLSPLQIRYCFPKQERLYLKLDIQSLFASGESFIAYPLRIVYFLQPTEQAARAQVLVSVAKKYFRRANKRNRVKRLIREAYRLNKYPFLERLEAKGLYAHLGIMCVGKELPTYPEVERALKKALTRIIERNEL